MIPVAILFFLIGAVLAWGFRVWILVPITLLGMISVVIVELAIGAGVSAAIGHGACSDQPRKSATRLACWRATEWAPLAAHPLTVSISSGVSIKPLTREKLDRRLRNRSPILARRWRALSLCDSSS